MSFLQITNQKKVRLCESFRSFTFTKGGVFVVFVDVALVDDDDVDAIGGDDDSDDGRLLSFIILA